MDSAKSDQELIDCREDGTIIMIFITIIVANMVIYSLISFNLLQSLRNQYFQSEHSIVKYNYKRSWVSGIFNNFFKSKQVNQNSENIALSENLFLNTKSFATKQKSMISCNSQTKLIQFIFTPNQQIFSQLALLFHWIQSLVSLASVQVFLFTSTDPTIEKKNVTRQMQATLVILKITCQLSTNLLMIVKMQQTFQQFDYKLYEESDRQIEKFNMNAATNFRSFISNILLYILVVQFCMFLYFPSGVLEDAINKARPYQSLHCTPVQIADQLLIFSIVMIWIQMKQKSKQMPQHITFSMQIGAMIAVLFLRLFISLFITTSAMLSRMYGYQQLHYNNDKCDKTKLLVISYQIFQIIKQYIELYIVWYSMLNKSLDIDGKEQNPLVSMFQDLEIELHNGFIAYLSQVNQGQLQNQYIEYNKFQTSSLDGTLNENQEVEYEKLHALIEHIKKKQPKQMMEIFTVDFLDKLEYNMHLFDNFTTLNHMKTINICFSAKLTQLQKEFSKSVYYQEIFKRRDGQIDMEANQINVSFDISSSNQDLDLNQK